MEPRERRYGTRTAGKISALWGRLLLLLFPLTLVFLAISIPLSVRAVRSDVRSREEEVLAVHGARGLRNLSGEDRRGAGAGDRAQIRALPPQQRKTRDRAVTENW